MAERELNDYAEASADITDILRGIILGEDIDVSRIAIWGEQWQPEFRFWYDQLVAHPDYAGPVSVRPWQTRPEAMIVATTANEACAMLLRAVYLTLLPDRPVLFGAAVPLQQAVDRTVSYVADNITSICPRVEQVYNSVDSGEWLRVIAMAEVERVTLQPDRPVTVEDAAATLVDSDYAEPILKSDLALLFDVDRATIARRIQSGELHPMPGTSDRAKKVRLHGDDFPPGLKRPNERRARLSERTRHGTRQ
jgi:hypothetical protein